MSPRFRRPFPLRLLVRALFPYQAPQPHPDPFYLFSSTAPQSPSVPSPCSLVRALSSQVPGRSSTRTRSRIPSVPGVEPSAVSQLITSIAGGSDDLESKLRLLNLTPSHALVLEVLRASNDRAVSAMRFFRWVLDAHPDFRPNSQAYNQMVCNLGLVDDYDSMHCMLVQLSSMGHSITEDAFSFLSRRDTAGVKDSVKRISGLLNKVGGRCRGMGIFSLIKLLCSMNAFDTAILVMSETARRTSYYNVFIAAKCRRRDFEGARGLFDEMLRTGCDPTTKSYNYLLGGLFKNGRFVEACDLLESMEKSGYLPDLVTFEVVLIHACKANKMRFAVKFLDRMLSEGFKPSLAIDAAFIKGYFGSGFAEDAYLYVVNMSTKVKYSTNANYSLLAKLYCTSGRVEEAGRILLELMNKGLKPNFPVYVRVKEDLVKLSREDLASKLNDKFNFLTHVRGP